MPVDVGSGAPAQGAANAPAANQPAANAPAANAPAANAAQGNAPAAPAANAAATNVPHEYHADAGNIVKLPANVSIDNIKVDGHNLVLVQPDGSEIVIKDGALNVPTFILGDVEVPRMALIAALESSHINVAFGADRLDLGRRQRRARQRGREFRTSRRRYRQWLRPLPRCCRRQTWRSASRSIASCSRDWHRTTRRRFST
ncbi:hypothetical protein ACVOMV_19020 [Mesorhizobium atlanticum]